MTTTAKNKTTSNTELEALRAELEAARAELNALKASQPTKELSAKAAARMKWHAACVPTQPADTMLGKAERMSREDLLVACFKATRTVKWDKLPAILMSLIALGSEEGGEDGVTTAEDLFNEVTTKKPRK